jgi:hypothetical protein
MDVGAQCRHYSWVNFASGAYWYGVCVEVPRRAACSQAWASRWGPYRGVRNTRLPVAVLRRGNPAAYAHRTPRPKGDPGPRATRRIAAPCAAGRSGMLWRGPRNGVSVCQGGPLRTSASSKRAAWSLGLHAILKLSVWGVRPVRCPLRLPIPVLLPNAHTRVTRAQPPAANGGLMGAGSSGCADPGGHPARRRLQPGWPVRWPPPALPARPNADRGRMASYTAGCKGRDPHRPDPKSVLRRFCIPSWFKPRDPLLPAIEPFLFGMTD